MRSLVFLLCFTQCILYAQQLDKHLWKHRLLLVIAADEDSELLQQQLKALNKPQELEERQLILYRICPKQYNTSQLKPQIWVKDSSMYQRYNSKNKPFKVVLIGLDGTIKYTKNSPISAKNLFTIIDGMPMRRSKMNTN